MTSEKSGGGGEVKNRIQELRKERRITQSELADAVDVTRQTIISLENGRKTYVVYVINMGTREYR